MMNLEDRFLKQNIPGQYSTWRESYYNDDDDDNSSCSSDHNGSNSRIRMTSPSPSHTHTNNHTSNIMSNHNNTGAKGVIQDYKLHKAMELQCKLDAQTQREIVLHRIAYGCQLMTPSEMSISRSSQSLHHRNDDNEDGDDEISFNEDEDEDEDEVMQRYSQHRFHECQNNSSKESYLDR